MLGILFVGMLQQIGYSIVGALVVFGLILYKVRNWKMAVFLFVVVLIALYAIFGHF